MFNKAAATDTHVTKRDLLQALYIDEDLASRNADIILDTLRLTSEETTFVQDTPDSIFWFNRRRWQLLYMRSIPNQHYSRQV